MVRNDHIDVRKIAEAAHLAWDEVGAHRPMKSSTDVTFDLSIRHTVEMKKTTFREPGTQTPSAINK